MTINVHLGLGVNLHFECYVRLEYARVRVIKESIYLIRCYNKIKKAFVFYLHDVQQK